MEKEERAEPPERGLLEARGLIHALALASPGEAGLQNCRHPPPCVMR